MHFDRFENFITEDWTLFSGGIILLLFKVAGSPYRRGFFCDDESLKHPFHDSTVTSGMLYGIGFVLAVVLVSLLLKQASSVHEKKNLLIKCRVPQNWNMCYTSL